MLPEIKDGEDKSSVLANRIRKNYRHLRKWARRTDTDCFRIYDRDIPQYPVALDFYAGRFCVYYYSRHKQDDEMPAELRAELLHALCAIFDVGVDMIYWKTRILRERTEQYEKSDTSREFFTVRENGVNFRINLRDYLDTGLFLDHRETRRIVAERAGGKRVLNLFAYTGSFSVHCAVKGATFTKTVDMSNTYTAWTKENFILNNLPLAHNQIVRADCLKFLEDEKRAGLTYDIIVVDPPTLSRSKKMDTFFDVQQDYPRLLASCGCLLAQGGEIYFSTNSRRFRFDTSLTPQFEVADISAKTIPEDFHDDKIHYCFKLTKVHG